jgi:putative aminopeptidase FrvX
VKEILKRLVCAYGPSGREDGIRKCIMTELAETQFTVTVDALGNLIATKSGQGKRLLLAAHMDEIGLMVTNIDDKGFLRFAPVGGHTPAILFGARVCFADGTIGTIGSGKIDDPKKLELDKLFIDAGFSSQNEAKGKIEIGSIATFAPHFALQSNRIFAKSLDNRAGCALLIALAKSLPLLDYQLDLVFTVQEEVGLRGARTAAYQLKPDMALAVDVTRTGDTPETPICMAVELGKGPAIKVKDSSIICHPQVKALLEAAADKEGIPYQLEVLERGGTDAGAIHLCREGVPTGAISIPARYVHTPVEVIDYGDLEGGLALLGAFCREFNKN